jgi:tetratricopeptide (TPR) repeat protein
MIFMGNKRPGRALLDFQTAAGLDSSSSDLFFDIGDAEQHLGDCRPAIASYLKSLQLNPNRKDVFLECGICHAALGETQAAIDDLSVVIAGDTTALALATAYHDRGALEERLMSHEMAIQDLNRSLKIDPANTQAQADLGFAYLAVGRKAEARMMFLSALQNRDALPDRGRRVIEALNDPGSNP